MRAVGYVRASSAGLFAAAEQEALIRAYARKEGLDLVEVHVDEPIGVLASAPHLGNVCSRAGIVALLDEAVCDLWQFVIVADRGHLIRSDVNIDPIAELQRREKQLVTVGEKLHLKREKAKKPKEKLKELEPGMSVAERLLRGREAGARDGKHQSGPAPYGYMRRYSDRNAKGVRLQINPKEAEIVQTIFKEYLRRRSMKRLIEFLDAQGLRTRRRKQWSRAGVSWILKNETYLGRVHFGNIRAKGQHPPIISPIIFNKVQKMIRKNNKKGGKNPEQDELILDKLILDKLTKETQ